jgi:hypothetical protein
MFKFVHAKTAADIIDPSTTLGIEITVPEIAGLCGLGNIDGQHGHSSTLRAEHFSVIEYAGGSARYVPFGPAEMAGRAAIEVAMSVPRFLPDRYACPHCGSDRYGSGCTENASAACVGGHVPPFTMATSRPDLDSIGAMAEFVLRELDLDRAVDTALVSAIAAADSFRPAAEWAPSPLPTEEKPWPRGAASVDSTPGVAHLGLICSPRRGDFTETKESLEFFLAAIDEYEQKISTWRVDIATWIERFPVWVDRASIFLTFFLLWFGLSQFGLILHGLSLRRGDDPLEGLREAFRKPSE